MFLTEPDISKLEKSKKVNKLIKALQYKKNWTVREAAAAALSRLQDPKAIPALLEAMRKDDSVSVRIACADALESLGFQPQKDEIGALYWCTRNHFQECADCGIRYAAPLLLRKFIESDDNTSLLSSWKAAYSSMGSAASVPLISLTEQIYSEYKSFISNIHSLNFMYAADKQKAAVIKQLSKKLCWAVKTIGAFGDREAFLYCQQFYNKVNNEIYSVPGSKFNDIYNAEEIRQETVRGFCGFPEELSGQVSDFLSDVLINDKSYFVRWAAVDLLNDWPVERVHNSDVLQNALRTALENEPDSVSSRKKYILKMLA